MQIAPNTSCDHHDYMQIGELLKKYKQSTRFSLLILFEASFIINSSYLPRILSIKWMKSIRKRWDLAGRHWVQCDYTMHKDSDARAVCESILCVY